MMHKFDDDFLKELKKHAEILRSLNERMHVANVEAHGLVFGYLEAQGLMDDEDAINTIINNTSHDYIRLQLYNLLMEVREKPSVQEQLRRKPPQQDRKTATPKKSTDKMHKFDDDFLKELEKHAEILRSLNKRMHGSNLNLEQMARRCPYAVPLGPTRLEGYRLLFRGSRSGAVATVEPHEGGSVPALLWEITPRCEEALDRYEGFPHLYRKETVNVTLNGKLLEALVYIMNDYPLGLPSRHYLGAILEGYASAGFDECVLNHALQQVSADIQAEEENQRKTHERD